MIESTVKIGANPKIMFPDLVNIFDCTIGDDAIIGPFVEITRHVTIGDRCSIESHAFICDSVTLQDDVFIGHGVVFTNDLYPRSRVPVPYARTIVERGASIGSNATIVCGITIGEYAVIGAGAVITKSVAPFSIWAGNPARELRRFDSREAIAEYAQRRQAERAQPR